MHDYKKLRVWQKSMDFATAIYHLTSQFPIDERFGLASQLKRAAISIPSNISEGAGRDQSNKVFSQFIDYASGSGTEVETQLILAKRLHLVKESEVDDLLKELSEILKMLYKFNQTLNK